MRTEDLFKYGVTPKEGPAKGQKFNVENVTKDGVSVILENGKDTAFFSHGEYDLWQEPKTLFEDDSIPATWGNLKKAVEAAGLGDGTKIAVHDFICGFREAEIRTAKLQSYDGKERIHIIVE